MRIYSISYDLNFQKNYPRLYDVLKSTGTWAKVNRSHWLVRVPDSQGILDAAQVVNQNVDADDNFWAVDVTVPILRGEWAGRLPAEVIQWLWDHELALVRSVPMIA